MADRIAFRALRPLRLNGCLFAKGDTGQASQPDLTPLIENGVVALEQSEAKASPHRSRSPKSQVCSKRANKPAPPHTHQRRNRD